MISQGYVEVRFVLLHLLPEEKEEKCSLIMRTLGKMSICSSEFVGVFLVLFRAIKEGLKVLESSVKKPRGTSL